MPKNTGAGMVIALFVFMLGFGIVWHIGWLIAVGFLGALIAIFARAFTEDTEWSMTAREVAHAEAVARKHHLTPHAV